MTGVGAEGRERVSGQRRRDGNLGARLEEGAGGKLTRLQNPQNPLSSISESSPNTLGQLD